MAVVSHFTQYTLFNNLLLGVFYPSQTLNKNKNFLFCALRLCFTIYTKENFKISSQPLWAYKSPFILHTSRTIYVYTYINTDILQFE